MQKSVILLSGPSCVGKTPLLNSLARVHPEKRWGRPVLYTSREPRPVEKQGVDYYFRSEAAITALPAERFVIAKTRNMWQAIHIDELLMIVQHYPTVIYDAHPALAEKFINHPRIMAASWLKITRIFLQPATLEEIADVQKALGDVSMQEATESIMAPKLIARSQQQGAILTPEVMRDIHVRASRAWEEILIGGSYDHILINHDGEDSSNWQSTPPEGDAGNTLREFIRIISAAG